MNKFGETIVNRDIAQEMQNAVKRICRSEAGEPDVALVTVIFAFIWSKYKYEGATTKELFDCLNRPNPIESYGDSLLPELFVSLPEETVDKIKSVLNLELDQNALDIFEALDFIDHKNNGAYDLFAEALDAVINFHQIYIRRQPTSAFVRNLSWSLLGVREGDTVTDLGGVLTDLFKNPKLEEINLEYIKPTNWFERTVDYLSANYYALDGKVEEIEVADWPSKKFDIVLANPVFEGGIIGTPYEVLMRGASFKHYKLLTLFIEMIVVSLSENGRALVVVPEGFLDSVADSPLRKRLVLEYNLRAVIQLPEGSLSPAKKVSGCILYFNNRTNSDQVRLVDLKRTLIDGKDPSNICEVILDDSKTGENSGFLCDKQYKALEENNWSLIPSKYLEKLNPTTLKSNDILKEVLKLEAELEECNYNIIALTKELEGDIL